MHIYITKLNILKMVNLIFHYIFYCITQLLAAFKITPLNDISDNMKELFVALYYIPIRPSWDNLPQDDVPSRYHLKSESTIIPRTRRSVPIVGL